MIWILPCTPFALSMKLRAPVRMPDIIGVKLTLIVQLPGEARELGHPFCTIKSPFVVTLAMISGATRPLPLGGFVSVTVWALLDIPTGCPPNTIFIGNRTAPGYATSGPLKEMLSGL